VNDASVAELGEIQRVTFWQIQNHLHPFNTQHLLPYEKAKIRYTDSGILDDSLKRSTTRENELPKIQGYIQLV